MFLPVLSLMVWRAILHQLAFSTSLTRNPGWNVHAIHATLRALALGQRCLVFIKADITVDPVAHLSGLDPSPAPSSSFNGEDCRAFDTSPRETNHFTIVSATGVWATTREVVEDIC